MNVDIPFSTTAEEMKEVKKHYKKLDEMCGEISTLFKEKNLCTRDVIYILDKCREKLNEKYLEMPF